MEHNVRWILAKSVRNSPHARTPNKAHFQRDPNNSLLAFLLHYWTWICRQYWFQRESNCFRPIPERSKIQRWKRVFFGGWIITVISESSMSCSSTMTSALASLIKSWIGLFEVTFCRNGCCGLKDKFWNENKKQQINHPHSGVQWPPVSVLDLSAHIWQ